MKFLAFSLCLLTASAFAADMTTFDCEMQKFPKHMFSFKMENMGKRSMTFVSADNSDGFSEVFTTKSKNETVKRFVDTLNGQGGDLRVQKDRIEFFGDSAGIDFAWLNLYKKTDYKTGFARIEFDFSNEKDYSKVTCKPSK